MDDKLVYEGNAFLLDSYTEKINKKFFLFRIKVGEINKYKKKMVPVLKF